MIATRTLLPAGLLCLATALLSFGCTSSSKPLGEDERVSLTLWSASDDRRFTYLEVSPLGELSFSGGQEAARREALPVLTLTSEQLARVRSILDTHGLYHLSSPGWDKKDKVRYELRLRRTGLAGRTLRTGDDRTPGVRDLHDYLFSLQAEKRYRVPLPSGAN